MTTSHLTPADLPADEQYRLVYWGITAVAADCDGAVEDDGIGFNGQDTKFGKRIASVPFEAWTEDIKAEAARIASRYRSQIKASIGLDIAGLPVVLEAQAFETNHAARSQARGFERLGLKTERKVTLNAKGNVLGISWNRRDPEFNALLAGVKALPGRRWNGSFNEVALTEEALSYIEEFGFEAPEGLEVPTSIADDSADADPDIVLVGNDRVRISFDYDPVLVGAVRNLPGRQYEGATKTNLADLDPAVLAFADEYGLVVADEVREALANIEHVISAEQAEKDLRKAVSGLANPADLPEEFVQRVLAATSKAVLV